MEYQLILQEERKCSFDAINKVREAKNNFGDVIMSPGD